MSPALTAATSGPSTDSNAAAGVTAAYRARMDEMHVCDVSVKWNRAEGERKLSSLPQEMGLPQGRVGEASGRGLEAEASCRTDNSRVSAQVHLQRRLGCKNKIKVSVNLCRCETQQVQKKKKKSV